MGSQALSEVGTLAWSECYQSVFVGSTPKDVFSLVALCMLGTLQSECFQRAWLDLQPGENVRPDLEAGQHIIK